MALNKVITIGAVSVILMACFVGCGPESKIALKFTPEDSAVYKVTQETTKEVRFEQPSINKSKVDTVTTTSEITFEQKITDVRENGDAIVDITIQGIKLYSKGKNGVNIDFDSAKEGEKDKLSQLIGKSYKIKVDKLGNVEVVDAKDAREAAATREAKALLRNDIIIDRHQVVAMPETSDIQAAKGKSWSKVVSSPKGSLEPKAFEKVYTVDKIKKGADSTMVTVKMEAEPTTKKPEGGVEGKGLGVMAGIFDATETYAGEMVFDASSGKVAKYTETLKADYVAAEEPKEGDASKGPDVLTMTFVSSYTIEELNNIVSCLSERG